MTASEIALPSPVRRIAILRALFLGDLLCATPAFRALRRRFPEAEITLIGLPWAEELMRRSPSLDRLAIFPGYEGLPEVEHREDRTAAFLAEARATGYDLAMQMHGDGNQTNGFVGDLGATLTVGYRRLGDDRLDLALPHVADEHEVHRWLRLVGLLGADTGDCRLDYPTTEDEARGAASLLAEASRADGPLVGLHAGGSTPLRRWPPARFAELARVLVERWDARIVLTGTERERELTGHVCRAAGVPMLDLAGRTDIGTFAALLGQLDLLVTNDTSASHLAAVAGTPSVVIFGSTQPCQWAPLDRDRHLVVDARTFAPPETSQVDALARLPVDPVLLACERHLDEPIPATAMPSRSAT